MKGNAAKRISNLALVATAVVLGLGGCSSLPTINPDMALTPRVSVQLQGARGPLTTDQSKAIIEKLKANSPKSSILDRHLAVEAAVVGSPLIVGNRVTLLQDGAATFPAVFNAIKRARDHINVETYILEDDEVGNQFANLLIEKQTAGIQVNLMYDSVGSIDTPKAFFARLTDSGVNVVEFNPVNPLTAKAGWNVNHRDHRKLMIIDGDTAFTGGVNISSVYSGGSLRQTTAAKPEARAPWRDTHMQIEGPVVAEFQKLFIASWEKQKGNALAPKNYFPKTTAQGQEIVRAIGSSPDEPGSLIYATLISAIRNAESAVNITNAYFVPDPQLLTALTDAAQRGVNVRLLLPSHSDSWLTLHVGRSHYEELLAAGVKIYERRDRILHAKTAMIDGVWSTVGSTNLDWRSFLNNDEVNAVILSNDFATQMKVAFERDIAQSNAITLSNWRNRPLSLRMRETFARLWQRGL